MQKVTIVGAGIVGLATGYQLLKQNPDLQVRILEKENEVAKHQTGNNSGVIHSGIYYKPGSLKAKNCREGKAELLAFCETHGIRTERLGKVIVATDTSQLPRLSDIEARGRANGVQLERIGSQRLKEIEPHVTAIEALWIPEAAIISYKEVSLKLAEEIRSMGGEIHFNTPFEEVGSDEFLINCAGLYSDRIARRLLGEKKVPHRILPFRGEYYELSAEKRSLVNGLIYPVPDPQFPFLGVHLTRMINGHVEAGPNAILATAREGYRKRDVNLVDCRDILNYPGFWKMAAAYWKAGFYEMARSCSKTLFLRDLQKLVPALKLSDLIPAGAGIRAQLVNREGRLVDDFAILEEQNQVHVLNAPSPAATASFSIGRHIATKVLRQIDASHAEEILPLVLELRR